MRANSSRAETFEPLKKGCGVWLSKRSARPGRACQGSAAGLDLLVPVVLARGAGVADARILAAYQAMAGANPPIPITPAKLATRAVTGYPTALRWLRIHHPELLVKPDEASVAPIAVAPVAPEPKPSPPETVQKQDAAPKKRGTAKASAKMLPKPLRNPKTHPELLADDHHPKTALKPSEAAQGDHDTAKAQKRGKRLRDPEKEPF